MKYLFIIFSFVYAFSSEPSLEQTHEQNKPDENKTQTQADINNSFITKYEYGKMLYNNPRGIGCNSCHGNDARGRKMVDFKQLHDKKIYNCSLIIPDIKNIDYGAFSTKVNSKKNSNVKFEKEQVCEKLIHYANVMPTYFLVQDEIDAIYYYIQNLK